MIDFLKLPSPCYVLDETLLDRNLAVIDRVRRESGAEIIVALKACAMWSIFPELARHSDGATASSAAEARLVFEEYGKPAHTYAPVYTDRNIDEILRCSDHITFNSVAQFGRFGPMALLRGISCGLRINPQYSPVETDLYNPCVPGSRLGVTADELNDLPAGIDGLHFHVLCESRPHHLRLAAMLDVSFACHMPDCLEMPYKPAIVGAHEPAEGEKRWRMGGTSCLAGDYCGDWAFDHELKVGERIVFEDMIHYTMVKTTMFNGVAHPSIVIARRDGRTDVIREFGYEDFRNRMS